MNGRLAARILGCAALALSLSAVAAAPGTSRVEVPGGAFAGLSGGPPAPPQTELHLAFELAPRGDLDALAARVSDPADPAHRAAIGGDALAGRYGRAGEARRLAAMLRAAGASDVYAARDGLVVGADLRVERAERFLHARWVTYGTAPRTVIAPAAALTVPVPGIRDVRGAVVATTPRLADVRASFTTFRGDWYEPARFREMTDAVPGGGAGQRIVVVEDASDRVAMSDVDRFLTAAGAPPGASAARVTERSFAFKAASSDCGRDDRGQEAALDVDGALTMAPKAEVVVDYDDVCSPGNDGTAALARALELDPTVIVFPFVVGPVDDGIAARYGATPLPILEALVRGIPLVVPSGDDGAYGYREAGIERPRVAWPCVSPLVICAGGTQLGDRDGTVDEGPWNDLAFASGGGVSTEPRPAWQDAPGDELFSPQYVKNRIVPDLAADAAGHLRVYWHGYGMGGVGGTSESAALVGGELAAVNAAVPAAHRLLTAGDLYVLARRAPSSFRDVTRENDRGYLDNTLRPRPRPIPKDYAGPVPTAPPLVKGCVAQQPGGCAVTAGDDAVTGLGDLLERPAIAALK